MDARVLLVDTNHETARHMAARLEAHRFHVERTASREAVDAALATRAPHLILLTLDLPDLDGLALMRDLRHAPATADMAIVGISRTPDADRRVACLELGAMDYIQWPVPEAELIARVKRHVTVVQVRTALKESEARFRSVTESAIDAIISAGRDGRILSWNRAAEQIFGHTAGDAIGQPLEIIIPERYRAAHAAGLRRVADGGPSRVIGSTVELAAVRRDGSELPIELSLATWTLHDDRYFTGIVRDVSTRKAAEDQLRAYADDLARSHAELQSQHEALRRSQDAILAFTRQNQRLFDAITSVMPGSVLDGRYRIDHRLATGGYGVVFAGIDVREDSPVAIKVFRPAAADLDTAAVRRFAREHRATGRVNHPNAVTILDSGVTSADLPYLVMERLTGETIAERLRRAGPFPPDTAAAILADVCDVLREAHAAGIVHRDVTPGNIFLHTVPGTGDAAPVVKVLDFGIATFLADASLETVTCTGGQLVGTPRYMAPERFSGQVDGPAVDIYSVGCLAMDMLTGRPRGADPLPPDTPAALRAFIQHATDPDPEARPRAWECAAVLRRVAAGPSTRPRPAASTAGSTPAGASVAVPGAPAAAD